MRWQDSFTWSPTDKPGQQVIVLAGKTLVEQEQQGFMTADRLSLWLNQVATQQRSSKLPYEPTRILAEGNSVIATDTAHVTVQSIDVSFVSIPTDISAPADSDNQQLGQFVNQPLVNKPAKSPGQTVTIDGQTLTASVANRGGQMWIDAMSIRGPLHLKSESSRSSVPWRVEGDVLNLGSTPEGDIDIEIAGQPASVHIADGSIMGPKIGFNQKQNRIWMDHPGEFTLPVEMGDSSSQQLRWAKPLRCTWQRRMMFDGDQVRFEGDIELLGTLQSQDSLWFLKGTCQELALAMNQPISLAQLSSLKTRPTVSQLEQIVLRGDVDLLASRKDAQGNRLSRARLSVPSTLTIFVPEQKVVAAGPGSAFTNYVNSPDSNFPASATTAPLNTLALTFRDSLVAFLDRKEVVVDGNVKILSSPIASWDDELTPDSIGRLLLDQFTCISDQVKLYDTNSLNSTQALLASRGSNTTSGSWEVQVTGNVRFEGATTNGDYSGNAYQAVYVQAKDQLYLSGDGRSKAVAVVKKRDGGSSQLDALTTLRLSRGRFNVKTLGMEDPQGLEVHVESPNSIGDPAASKSSGGGSATSPANNSTLDPRDRSINRLLQGFGPQQP